MQDERIALMLAKQRPVRVSYSASFHQAATCKPRPEMQNCSFLFCMHERLLALTLPGLPGFYHTTEVRREQKTWVAELLPLSVHPLMEELRSELRSLASRCSGFSMRTVPAAERE